MPRIVSRRLERRAVKYSEADDDTDFADFNTLVKRYGPYEKHATHNNNANSDNKPQEKNKNV